MAQATQAQSQPTSPAHVGEVYSSEQRRLLSRLLRLEAIKALDSKAGVSVERRVLDRAAFATWEESVGAGVGLEARAIAGCGSI